MFVITFAIQVDKQRVWDGKPWMFDNNSLVLNMFDGFSQPNKMNFDTESFWIQMHNLHLACMNIEFREQWEAQLERCWVLMLMMMGVVGVNSLA